MVRFLELRKRSMCNHNVRKLYDLNNMFQAFCVPVSVPMEFLPVPIAAHVGVQRHVRPQGYQSQFLWNSSQFLWLPKCGCKNIFTLKVTSLSSYGIPSSSYSCQVGVQRCVRPQSYQSQFLWNPPSSYSCPGGGAKVCSPHVKIKYVQSP